MVHRFFISTTVTRKDRLNLRFNCNSLLNMSKRALLWKELKDISKGNPRIPYKTSTIKDLEEEIAKIRTKIISDKLRDGCSICLECIDENQILKLDCNHIFHRHCLRRNVFEHIDDKCPLCRKRYEYKVKNKSQV